MGEIVAAIGMSHAPPLTADADAPPEDELARMRASLNALQKGLDDARPDLIVAVIDDHFENFFGALMPTFAVSLAPSNFGPPDHYLEWLKIPQREIPNDVELSTEILRDGLASGFDLARTERISYGHALMVPLHFLRPEHDLPVVPIVTNVFTPPLAPAWRAYDLGLCIRETLLRRSVRVAILATGALSHWPPFWKRDSPMDDEFFVRMHKFQTLGLQTLAEDPELFVDLGHREREMAASGQPLVNPEWDRRMLQAFELGDVDFVRSLRYEDVEREGGNGGHEILNWIVMMGIVGGAPARVLSYDPVEEWMCGMGFISYDADVLATPRARGPG